MTPEASGSWLAAALYTRAGWPGIVSAAVSIAAAGILAGILGLKRDEHRAA